MNVLSNGKLAFVVLSCFVASSAQGDFVNYSSQLSGDTDFDGWDNLSVLNPQVIAAAGAFGSFPGASPWPAPIESILTNDPIDVLDDDPTGDATFGKLSGNGYPSGSSIYGGAVFGTPTGPYPSATHQMADLSLVDDIETVIFQIEVGSGSAGWLDGDPELKVNGTGSGLTPTAELLLESVGGDSDFGPLVINTYAFQWDLTDETGPITSYTIDFTMDGSSTQIYALQLDSGDTYTLLVPEPASLALAGVGGMFMLLRTRPNPEDGRKTRTVGTAGPRGDVS